MERYKPINYGSRWEYLLFEMSQDRQRAERRIDNNMIQLLIHLIAVDTLGINDRDYEHHLSEVRKFKNIVVKANTRKKTNKRWFSYEFVNGIAADAMPSAMYEFEKKFGVEPRKEYIDLNDFNWFSLEEIKK